MSVPHARILVLDNKERLGNKMTNTKKCMTKGHEYPVENEISLGCPICFGEWIDAGLTLD